IKQSLYLAEKRHDLIKEFEDTPGLKFPPKGNLSSIENWSGAQLTKFEALERYVALEPEGGPVGQLVEEFLEEHGEEFVGAANATKTSASKADILQAFDFSQGPWKDAEEITHFRVMGKPDQHPS